MIDPNLLGIGTMVRDSYSTPAAVAKYHARIEQGLRIWEETVVRQYFPECGAVLVVGCGAGREVLALERLGYSMTGVDISPPLLEVARQAAADRRSSAHFQLVDGVALPFADESYDAVTLWSQLLGNVPGAAGRLSLLREGRRVLRPGGVLSLSVHDRCRTLPQLEPDWILSTGDPEPGDLYLQADEDTSRYWHYFDMDEVRSLCRGAGFADAMVVHTSDLGQHWDNVLVAVCAI